MQSDLSSLEKAHFLPVGTLLLVIMIIMGISHCESPLYKREKPELDNQDVLK